MIIEIVCAVGATAVAPLALSALTGYLVVLTRCRMVGRPEQPPCHADARRAHDSVRDPRASSQRRTADRFHVAEHARVRLPRRPVRGPCGLTEDLELQTVLVLDGEVVAFAPDAVVEAEIPATLEASQTQNERWERGRIDLAKRSIPALLRRAARTRGRQRFVAIDAALDHAVPPLSVLAAATAGLAGWFAAANRVVPSRLVRVGSRASQFALLGLAIHVLLGLRVARAPRTVYRSLLMAPRAIVWKVNLWLRMLLRPGEVPWIRTRRNTEQPTTEVRPW